MNGSRTSLADLAGRLEAPPASLAPPPLIAWLETQRVEELDEGGLPTGRTGRVAPIAAFGNVDLATSLPVSFVGEVAAVPLGRLRFARQAPALDAETSVAALDDAYRAGFGAEIVVAYAQLSAPSPHWRVYGAAALAELGQLPEALEQLAALEQLEAPEGAVLSPELALLSLHVQMDSLRRLDRAHEAFALWQAWPALRDVSDLSRARHLICEASTRHAADDRDALAPIAIDRAITLLADGPPEELAEALMQKGRMLCGDEPEQAEEVLARALALVRDSDALPRAGRILGNLAWAQIGRDAKASLLAYASAAAACFRPVGYRADLRAALGMIALEETDEQRAAGYRRETLQLSGSLRLHSAFVDTLLWQLAEACAQDELSSLSSADGLGQEIYLHWAEHQAEQTGLDQQVLLHWLVSGARFYHATVRRGRPAVSSSGPAVKEAVDHWLEAHEEEGSEESAQLRGLLHHVSETYPGSPLAFARAMLARFIDGVDVTLDENDLRAFLDLIGNAQSLGFRLEFVFESAVHQVLHEDAVTAGMEEMMRLRDTAGPAEVFDEAATTRAILPDGLPWPLDQRCPCGAHLRRFIYCCKPDELIDLAPHRAQLEPGFTIERACCDASLSGFRCDCCHRVHTWALGVVPTHATPEQHPWARAPATDLSK